ncbi:signal peptidase I [Arthrobacter sp. TMN-49]
MTDLLTAPAPTTPAAPASSPQRGVRAVRRRLFRSAGLWQGAAAVVIGALVLAAVVFLLAGGRWFIVSSPSMGQAAPVGTLVLTTPTTVADLHPGDIVTFHPPTAPDEVYTHRVQTVTGAGSVATRGDINDINDPWTLHRQDLIGKAVGVLPAAGWAVRAFPLLTLGSVALWVLTARFASTRWRVPLRVVGLSVVVSCAAFILRPFVGLIILSTSMAPDGARAVVVSTGLLPIRAQAAGGSHADLDSGMVGRLDIPSLADSGYYQISSALHLSPFGWVMLGFVCAIPLLWCLIIGLPPAPQPAKSRS